MTRRLVEIIQNEEGVWYDDPDTGERLAVPCQWWAMCPNVATRTRPHPILGDVPICVGCLQKIARIEGDG